MLDLHKCRFWHATRLKTKQIFLYIVKVCHQAFTVIVFNKQLVYFCYREFLYSDVTLDRDTIDDTMNNLQLTRTVKLPLPLQPFTNIYKTALDL